jgi:hypothetical protein
VENFDPFNLEGGEGSGIISLEEVIDGVGSLDMPSNVKGL